MRRRSRSLSAALFGLVACSTQPNMVPRTVHQEGAKAWYVDVPPPPVRVETLRPAPGPECAWLDGQWLYQEGDWHWQPGRWLQVPDHCYFADPTLRYVQDQGVDRIKYTPGQWYPDEPGRQCQQISGCTASTAR